jgi:hypothetical protein
MPWVSDTVAEQRHSGQPPFGTANPDTPVLVERASGAHILPAKPGGVFLRTPERWVVHGIM